MNNRPWPNEWIEALKELVAQGQSASQIAGVLKLSRNAVIGKAHRIKVTFKNRSGRQAPKSKARRNKYRAALNGWHRQGEKMQPKSEPEPEIVAELVTFAELAAHHCRWPVAGQGYQTLFCGAEAVAKQPYCPRHWRLAQAR